MGDISNANAFRSPCERDKSGTQLKGQAPGGKGQVRDNAENSAQAERDKQGTEFKEQGPRAKGQAGDSVEKQHPKAKAQVAYNAEKQHPRAKGQIRDCQKQRPSSKGASRGQSSQSRPQEERDKLGTVQKSSTNANHTHFGTSTHHSSAPCAVSLPALLQAALQVASDFPKVLHVNST